MVGVKFVGPYTVVRVVTNADKVVKVVAPMLILKPCTSKRVTPQLVPKETTGKLIEVN